MNTFAVLAVALVLVVSAQAGPHRVVRQSGWGSGWAAPPPCKLNKTIVSFYPIIIKVEFFDDANLNSSISINL